MDEAIVAEVTDGAAPVDPSGWARCRKWISNGGRLQIATALLATGAIVLFALQLLGYIGDPAISSPLRYDPVQRLCDPEPFSSAPSCEPWSGEVRTFEGREIPVVRPGDLLRVEGTKCVQGLDDGETITIRGTTVFIREDRTDVAPVSYSSGFRAQGNGCITRTFNNIIPATLGCPEDGSGQCASGVWSLSGEETATHEEHMFVASWQTEPFFLEREGDGSSTDE